MTETEIGHALDLTDRTVRREWEKAETMALRGAERVVVLLDGRDAKVRH